MKNCMIKLYIKSGQIHLQKWSQSQFNLKSLGYKFQQILFSFYKFYMLLFERRREGKQEGTLTFQQCTSQMPVTTRGSKASSWEHNLCLYHREQSPITWTSTYCLSNCTSAGSWKWEPDLARKFRALVIADKPPQPVA